MKDDRSWNCDGKIKKELKLHLYRIVAKGVNDEEGREAKQREPENQKKNGRSNNEKRNKGGFIQENGDDNIGGV